VLTTGGSVENGELLAARRAEVALLQENAITAQAVAVAAPLYYDVVHFVVRKNRGIAQLQDLAGRQVSLGAAGSGMRLNALQILESAGIAGPRSAPNADRHFTALLNETDLDAALVTTGCRNADLRRVLAEAAFELLPLDESLIETLSLRYPSFRAYVIRRGAIREAVGEVPAIPVQDVRTVATTTFLAVRRDARPRLVTTLLRSLYREPQVLRDFDVLPPSDAARWKEFALHPAALRFFAAYHEGP
jgi:TRAP transporter TAXI family solute receptor